MAEGVTRIDPADVPRVTDERAPRAVLLKESGSAPTPDPSVASRSRGSTATDRLNSDESGHPSLRQVYLVLWLLVAGGSVIAGFDYYTTPYPDRPLHPQHDLFAPSGSFGLLLALSGTVMMFCGVLLYVGRKCLPTLSGWGDVRDWLRTHVFLSTLGPFLIVLHTGFAFGATATWAFACMMMVGGLGVVGLYLYAWIPRTSDGKVVPRERLETERTALAQRVWEMSDAHPERVATLTERLSVRRTPGYVSAVWVSLVYQVSGRRRRRYLAAALSIADTAPTDLENAVGILEQQHRIETQLALAPALGSIYRGWRRVLLPLAVGTLALVIVHIAAVVRAMMGGVL